MTGSRVTTESGNRLSIPIPRSVGGSFLEGDGRFQLATDLDVWSTIVDRDQPFKRGIDKVADVSVGLDTNRDVKIGRPGDFALSLDVQARALHQVQLLWPEEDVGIAKSYGLDEFLTGDRLYLRVRFDGKAGVDARAGFPVGPLSATVGIGAGGYVSYERFMPADASTPALRLLTDLYSGIRLPQHVDDRAEIPAPGELLITRFGGYLHLSAGLTWGYSLTASQEVDFEKLRLDLEYRFRAVAAVSFGYQLAGDFQIEARRGRDPGWVRFVVRKSRESQSSLAADFGIEGAVELTGFPVAVDDFLSKLLGTHVESVLALFSRARRYTSVEELEKAAGKLLRGLVHSLATRVLDQRLDERNLREFLNRMDRVAEDYAQVAPAILDLYASFVADPAEKLRLLSAMELVLGAATRAELVALAETTDFQAILDLIRRLYEGRTFDVLQDDRAFAELSRRVSAARAFVTGEEHPEVKALIDHVRGELPADQLMKELARVDRTTRLLNLADERLQGLVERLVGRAFDELDETEAGRALELLHNDLEKIESFKKKWYRNLQDAVKHSFQAKLHFAYTRSRRNERLLDVEINLNEARGRDLARAASRGDFFRVLDDYRPSLVRIHSGLFDEELRTAGEVKVNVLGWGSNGIVNLVSDTEHAVEAQPGGLLHVYASDTYVERRRTSGARFKEEVESTFLVKSVAETFQKEGARFRPYALDILKSMAFEYKLLQKDQDTTVEELAAYLELARMTGLLDVDPLAYALRVQEECGGRLGDVSVSYVVRYDPREILNVFTIPAARREQLPRETLRELLLRKYAGMKNEPWLALVAFAYVSEESYAWYRDGSLDANLKTVKVPAWLTGSTDRELSLSGKVPLVRRLFNVEEAFVERFGRLDDLVDRLRDGFTVDERELTSAARALLDVGNDLNDYDDNALFAVVDRLIAEGSAGTAHRESAVILEVATRGGGRITKVLMAGPREDEIVEA